MKPLGKVTVVVLALGGALAGQQAANPLQQKLKDTAVDARWIYNDLGAGLAEARKAGKPLLVVFR
jgi:hypothetical protein